MDKIFSSFPLIETRRMVLRELILEDAIQILKMRSSKKVNQHIARPEMDSEEKAKSLVTRCHEMFQNKAGIPWAGVIKGSNELIGTCGFNMLDWDNRRAEIGGELSPDFWGKNIAFEAVEAIIKFGFENLELHAIEAKMLASNRSALYVLQKLGFEKEAHFKERVYFNNTYHDLVVYTKFTNSKTT